MSKKTVLDLTKEEILEAFKDSYSIKGILDKLGFPPHHRNYARLDERCSELGLTVPPTKRFTNNYRELSEILVLGSSIDRTRLKTRLFESGLLENKCSECSQEPWWNGKLLVLELDHINGDPKDNRIENLRFLCPNCHQQTATWGNKVYKIKRASGVIAAAVALEATP